jgi:sigma-B regulation protein RsbU (phosphoserine phosphatase)
MFTLRDFFHLPQLDPLVDRMLAEPAGLLVVAGIDPLLEARSGLSGFLPSGRQALFGMLMDALLAKYPKKKCIVVTQDKKVLRVQRQFRRQVQFDLIDPSTGYADRIGADALLQPGLLVIDRLEPENARPAFEAAQRCLVLSQLNTVFYGAQVVRQLAEMRGAAEAAAVSCWVLTVQRMPALCVHCKVPVELTSEQKDRLSSRFDPGSMTAAPSISYQGRGCPKCNHTGRFGDVAVFDVFYQEGKSVSISNPAENPSLLGIETYIYELVRSGYLPVEDLLNFEAAQFRRTFDLFQKMERAFIEKKSSLESRLVQLEAAHKVLQRRTEALITLQTMSQGMIASGDLGELARHICRYACQLCNADRAILYSQGQEGNTEVLAVFGWEAALVRRRLDMDAILDAQVGAEPAPFDRLPPGVPPAFADQRPLGAGLAVSLYIQHEWVGLMILHAKDKNRFLPGEVALLQTFANQAALAIQRAGLVEQLRARLDQLEAAQAQLARKERLEREMELARQVQQSLLPQGFPDLPGFRFAAQCVPARQVGGDFYDVIPLGGGAFGLAIADVSDKGMPAALYMALARSLLRAEAQRERSPEAVLRTVNRLLLELAAPSLFVTLFYGVVEPGTRQLTYVRAGHEAPYILRDGKLRPLSGEGIALGLLDPGGFRVSEEQLELYPGDRLILFTDGLTDVFDPAGQIYDRERLEQLLLGSRAVPLEALCESVFAALARFQGESDQFDDMTMLVVEVG